jgi:hypothetical protein
MDNHFTFDVFNSKSNKIDFLPSSSLYSHYDSKESFSNIDYPNLDQNYDTAVTSNVLFDLSSLTNSAQKDSAAEFDVKCSKISDHITRIVNFDEYIDGEISKTELYLEKLYIENKAVFRESFQRAWLQLFAGSKDNLATFINISSNISYQWLEDRADALVLSACSHQDPFVNEAAVRAIEAWEQTSHIEYLENIREFNIGWLEKYKVEVLEYLKTVR